MIEQVEKQSKTAADTKSDAMERSRGLQDYVKMAVHFMLFPNGDSHDWEQELTANSIMESYGMVLMLTEYELANATTVARENYPKVAAFVKSVHHKMIDDLHALADDPFVAAVLEADSIYRECEDRIADGEVDEDT